MIGWERFSRSGVALSVVGHVALLLGLTYIGVGAVRPIAPEVMIVEIVPPSEAPASPANRASAKPARPGLDELLHR
jgi:hypothetical protein